MPGLSDTWRSYPLFRLVLEEILKNPRGIPVKEILDNIKKEHGYDISKPELYEVLLRLELRGYITVYRIGKEMMAKPSKYIDKLLS